MMRMTNKMLKFLILTVMLILSATSVATAKLGDGGCPVGTPSRIIEKAANASCGMVDGKYNPDPDLKCFWFSKPLYEIFWTMDNIGKSVYDSLAGTNGNSPFAVPVLGIFFAIWMAWHTLRYVGPLYKQAPSDFAMLIGGGLFRLLVAVCLIEWGADKIFDTFIGTFVTAAANVGTSIMQKASLSMDDVGGFEIYDPENKYSEGVMALYAAISLNIKTAASMFMEIVGMGLVLVDFSFDDGILCLLPSIDPLWTGYVLMFAGAVLVFIIPFKFLDILFRLTLVYALLPMLLTAWVFPSTRKYTMKAWGIVMNAVCLMLIMSVLFALCTGMMSNLVMSGSTNSEAFKSASELYKVFKTDESCEDKNMLLIMLVAVFIAIKSLGVGKQLAGHFSESDGGSVAEGVLNAVTGAAAGKAAMAGSAALGMAGGSLLNKATGGLKSLGGRIGGAAGSLAGLDPKAAFNNLAPGLSAGVGAAIGFKGNRNMLASASGGGSGANDAAMPSVGSGGSAGPSGGNAIGGANAKSLKDKLAAIGENRRKENDNLDKDIMEKLGFVNKDVLDKLDHEKKKSLLDAADALDKARRVNIGTGNGQTHAFSREEAYAAGGYIKEQFNKNAQRQIGANAEDILRNAVNDFQNGDLSAEGLKNVSDNIKNTMDNPQAFKSKKGDRVTNATNSLKSKYENELNASRQTATNGTTVAGDAAAVAKGGTAAKGNAGAQGNAANNGAAAKTADAASSSEKVVKDVTNEALNNNVSDSQADAKLENDNVKGNNREKENKARELEAELTVKIRKMEAKIHDEKAREKRIDKGKEMFSKIWSANLYDKDTQKERDSAAIRYAENSVAGGEIKTDMAAVDENGKPIKNDDDV